MEEIKETIPEDSWIVVKVKWKALQQLIPESDEREGKEKYSCYELANIVKFN